MNNRLLLNFLCCTTLSLFGAKASAKREELIVQATNWIAERPESTHLNKNPTSYHPSMENVIRIFMHHSLDSVEAFLNWAHPDIAKLQIEGSPLLFHIISPDRQPERFASTMAILLQKNSDALTQQDNRGRTALEYAEQTISWICYPNQLEPIREILTP